MACLNQKNCMFKYAAAACCMCSNFIKHRMIGWNGVVVKPTALCFYMVIVVLIVCFCFQTWRTENCKFFGQQGESASRKFP